MGKDGSRVLVLALVYLVTIALTTFVMDWFSVRNTALAMFGADKVGIDLREATACVGATCQTIALGSGTYATIGVITFWGAMLFSLVVAYQAFTRIVGGVANESISRMAIYVGLGLVLAALSAGYLFAPEAGLVEKEVLGLTVERTWAPLLMVAGLLVGVYTLHVAASLLSDDSVGTYVPVTIVKPDPARAKRPSEAPLAQPRATTASGIAQPPTTASGVAQSRTPPSGVAQSRTKTPSGTVLPIPPHLKNKLAFVVITAELSRAGIDARREDGTSLLVMWRDVVGVVVRRLPPELDGETFLDLVSTKGSTLRVLAWTRLTGENVPAASGDARVRALATYVIEHCPEVTVDPATTTFLEQPDEPAAQLKTIDKLAAHDARLS